MTITPRRHDHRWSFLVWGGAATLLLLPAIAMHFTPEVRWTISDFVVAGAMLGSAAAAWELLARSSGGTLHRAGAALAVVTGLALLWADLAVGIIGSERNPANLAYLGVLAIAIGGGIASRGSDRGMARTMIAAAVVQIAIAAWALATGAAAGVDAWPYDLIGATGMFAALWLGAAWLFGRAAHQPA